MNDINLRLNYELFFIMILIWLPRTVDFGTYIQNWLQSAAIVSTSNLQKYVTLPDKQIPIHFNVTNVEVKAAIGGLTFLGLGEWNQSRGNILR